MRRTGRTMRLLLFVLVTFLLTGCGIGAKHENTDAGMKAIQNRDYTGALDCFEKALVNNEDQQLIYRGQGIAYIGLAQYEEAEKALLKSISYDKSGPDNMSYDSNYYLATAYYKTSEYEKAIKIYDAIIAMRPKETNAYYLRGSVEMSNEQYDAAVADFDKAVSLSKSDYDMYINIYQSFAQNDHKEEGQTYLKGLLDQNSDNMSNYDLGRMNFYLEDYENARNELEEARTEASSDADVILLLGKTYEVLGDYNYAGSVYLNYLKDDPNQVEVYNQLGLCKMKMEDYQSALEAFQSALAIENNSMTQTLQYNEIVAYEYLGEYKQAAVSMENYLKSYPDDEKAQREYEFLQTR